MKHTLVITGFVLSLALLLLTIWFWIASYHTIVVATDGGRLYVIHALSGNETYFRDPNPLVDKLDAARSAATSRWHVLGIDYFDSMICSSLGIPFHDLALVPLALCAWCYHLIRRQRRRQRMGLCLGCGYDLRESSGRCPECGLEIIAAKPAA